MQLQRRGFFALGFALAIPPGIDAAEAADGAPATVSQFYGSLVQVMKDGNQTPFQQRFRYLAPAVDDAFDLNNILRVSVGPEWGSIPDAQRQQLFAAFQAFTVATYVANFHSYNGQTISVSPATKSVSASKIVSSTITDPGNDSSRIDYVLRQEAARWKVVDILLEGTISRVAVQRSDFSSLVSEGNASQLIATLKRKVGNLSNGAISV
jgi:phospholipid transport system substrate-binding protein